MGLRCGEVEKRDLQFISSRNEIDRNSFLSFLGTSDTKQPKEAKVHYQKIPNTDDFSQSITDRIGPEFMEQLRAKGLI